MPKNRCKNKSPSHRVSPKKPEKDKDREDEQVEPKFLKRKGQNSTDDDGSQALLVPLEAGPSRITLDSTPPPPDPIDLDGQAPPVPVNPSPKGTPKFAGDLKATLQTMVEGDLSYSKKQKRPGKYLALDCEMVGVGPKGTQSSVARVSVVNYYGAVQMDEFVQQRERVVDHRTPHSGIRKSDLDNGIAYLLHLAYYSGRHALIVTALAKSFDEIQSRVAELLKDKVLVGHAVFHDLQALSLAHPQTQTLDTQSYAWKFKVAKVKCIALRHLVKQELGLTIQDGEHSSVTDARATMAIFRLHEREWEKDISSAAAPNTNTNKKKRKLGSEEQHDPQSPVELARGGGGLNANKTQDKNKNKNKKGKKGKKNIKNKKPDAQPRLACAWGRPEPGPPLGLGSVWTWDPEPGPPLGLGSVWAWDPEPDVWAGWDEPPQSRSGLGWGGGGGVLSEDRGCAWDGDDDIEHWGRDASKGWSW
ncbi:hypothetical protein CCMSSC00406_0009748 [Pleurotus cornucopiae]|uniref:Uncharacterized protein n=1 Tax=Pleurotus cornucopiae TaxID=5321 RepID=A0ACB7JCS8_PLECO|nr:hypothetical protein CCMSSC00406_0009748 [Pleurotus cornucopiae]